MTRGLIELDVPLRMKAGPTVMLHMKACLLTPDVQLSAFALAFGPVQTGKCKVLFRLHAAILELLAHALPAPAASSKGCWMAALLSIDSYYAGHDGAHAQHKGGAS